jgi:hypothetical protein
MHCCQPSAHDFLKTWVVDKQPNNAIAYFSRLSYPCLEAMAEKRQKPVPPGMVRLRLSLAMQKFNESTGTVASVGDVFKADTSWPPELKEVTNAYPAEFRLVSVAPDMALDEQCVPVPAEEADKESKEKFYATAFRGEQGDRRNRVMSLLWTKGGSYWKIVAIRLEDSSDAGFTPKITAAAPPVSEPEPAKIAGDQRSVLQIRKRRRMHHEINGTQGYIVRVAALADPVNREASIEPKQRLGKSNKEQTR